MSVKYTEAQIDALKLRIANYTERTRDEHGREIEKPPIGDLVDLLASMEDEVSPSGTARVSRAAFQRE